jgi:hypothetical protein
VLLDGARDGFLVSVSAKGVRGRMYCTTYIDGELMKIGRCESRDQVITLDVAAACQNTLELCRIPAEIKLLELGCLCPVHRPDPENDETPWHIVNAIDVERWRFSCTLESEHEIPWPEFAGRVRGGYYDVIKQANHDPGDEDGGR